MQKTQVWCWLVSISWMICLPVIGADNDAIETVDSAKRIVFLGDSITYAGGYVSKVSIWLKEQQPANPPTVLNLGLPSETVSGLSEDGHAGGRFPRPHLHERLQRVLKVTQPDLVIACYGINCGIYQQWDTSRFKAFQHGMRQLHDQVMESGASIIHVTPPSFDAVHFKTQSPENRSYNDVLSRYSDWLLEQRKQGWTVVDLHGPMTEKMLSMRSQQLTLQPDGVHPNRDGHALIAETLLQAFGADPSWQPPSKNHLANETKRMLLLRNAYLSAAGHQRPGIPEGLPISEAEQKASEVAP